MYNVGVEVMLVLNCGGGRCPRTCLDIGFWNSHLEPFSRLVHVDAHGPCPASVFVIVFSCLKARMENDFPDARVHART